MSLKIYPNNGVTKDGIINFKSQFTYQLSQREKLFDHMQLSSVIASDPLDPEGGYVSVYKDGVLKGNYKMFESKVDFATYITALNYHLNEDITGTPLSVVASGTRYFTLTSSDATTSSYKVCFIGNYKNIFGVESITVTNLIPSVTSTSKAYADMAYIDIRCDQWSGSSAGICYGIDENGTRTGTQTNMNTTTLAKMNVRSGLLFEPIKATVECQLHGPTTFDFRVYDSWGELYDLGYVDIVLTLTKEEAHSKNYMVVDGGDVNLRKNITDICLTHVGGKRKTIEMTPTNCAFGFYLKEFSIDAGYLHETANEDDTTFSDFINRDPKGTYGTINLYYRDVLSYLKDSTIPEADLNILFQELLLAFNEKTTGNNVSITGVMTFADDTYTGNLTLSSTVAGEREVAFGFFPLYADNLFNTYVEDIANIIAGWNSVQIPPNFDELLVDLENEMIANGATDDEIDRALDDLDCFRPAIQDMDAITSYVYAHPLWKYNDEQTLEIISRIILGRSGDETLNYDIKYNAGTFNLTTPMIRDFGNTNVASDAKFGYLTSYQMYVNGIDVGRVYEENRKLKLFEYDTFSWTALPCPTDHLDITCRRIQEGSDRKFRSESIPLPDGIYTFIVR